MTPKIPHYTRKGKLSAAELRAFRSRVSELKKQGLIRKGLPASSARPYNISGGKTLAEIVNKSFEPPKPKLLKARAPFKVVNLSDEVPSLKRHFKSLTKELEYLEAHAAEIDKLKKDDEYWTFRIFNTDSMAPYSNIDLLLEDLLKYRSIPGHPFNSRFEGQEILGSLKIMRWNGGATEWQQKRKFKPRKANPAKAARDAARRRAKKKGS